MIKLSRQPRKKQALGFDLGYFGEIDMERELIDMKKKMKELIGAREDF